MNKEDFLLEDLPGPIRDLDLSDTGWVSVCATGTPSYPGAQDMFRGFEQRGVSLSEQDRSFYMQRLRVDAAQVLMFNGREAKMPKKLRSPIVRAIDDNTAVVVDARGYPNPLWVIDSNGKVQSKFNVNDAIADILVSAKWIVVTYFDEWAATGEGLEVYDVSGRLHLSYEKDFGDEAVNVSDCYCACWVETNKLAFFPYSGFPLVQLDLSSFTQEIWATPETVSGAHSVTTLATYAFFHSPYHSRDDILKWQIGSDDTAHVGKIKGSLRGLQGGRFLSLQESGYAVLSFTPDLPKGVR